MNLSVNNFATTQCYLGSAMSTRCLSFRLASHIWKKMCAHEFFRQRGRSSRAAGLLIYIYMYVLLIYMFVGCCFCFNWEFHHPRVSEVSQAKGQRARLATRSRRTRRTKIQTRSMSMTSKTGKAFPAVAQRKRIRTRRGVGKGKPRSARKTMSQRRPKQRLERKTARSWDFVEKQCGSWSLW